MHSLDDPSERGRLRGSNVRARSRLIFTQRWCQDTLLRPGRARSGAVVFPAVLPVGQATMPQTVRQQCQFMGHGHMGGLAADPPLQVPVKLSQRLDHAVGQSPRRRTNHSPGLPGVCQQQGRRAASPRYSRLPVGATTEISQARLAADG